MRGQIEFELECRDGEIHSYTYTAKSALGGLKLLRELGYLGSRSMGAIGGLKSQYDINEMDPITAAQAVDTIFSALDHLGNEDLIKGIFDSAERDGKPLKKTTHFNEAFQANYGEMFQAILRILNFEYGGGDDELPFDLSRSALEPLSDIFKQWLSGLKEIISPLPSGEPPKNLESTQQSSSTTGPTET